MLRGAGLKETTPVGAGVKVAFRRPVRGEATPSTQRASHRRNAVVQSAGPGGCDAVKSGACPSCAALPLLRAAFRDLLRLRPRSSIRVTTV